ncbi:VWA domain-containing protein [Bacillus sp. FJAT-49736]|uniref:VWA domain-containing protein n=1 Tax=Bacillus sp. FJAT-49736 TaxID=2833582 RepID=UPI001BCA60BD|nr:VWA domain-containing protein [Bacillus sp. FJAT-49736]MBS4175853.1 VWA domain-containing protein [Bacillus sp. FJAT-49736]
MNKRLIILVISALVLLSGCGSKEITNKHNDKEKETKVVQQGKVNENTGNENSQDPLESDILKNVPAAPTDSKGFIQQEVGEFAGENNFYDNDKIKAEIRKLPPLKENPTSEELDAYYNYAYQLISADFPDPEDIIKKWEFANFGSPDMPDKRYQFKNNYNIEIILDSSGSMANAVGSKTRMQMAKDAIKNFLSRVPQEANVSLRVYGHKGTSKESDKVKSCSAIEQVYGFDKYNESKFNRALEKFQPSGWTPLANSLLESKKAFEKYDAKKNTNLIYVVSDGIETCGGDPVKVAKSFSDTNVSPIINVIGFGADKEAQKQLKEVAKEANGVYTTVSNERELSNEFARAEDVLNRWKEWKQKSLKEIDWQRVRNNFDILGFTNEWSRLTTQQSVDINHVFQVMQDEKIISVFQKDDLQARSNQMEDSLMRAKQELETDLKQISLENLEKVKQEIEQKYNDNTK